MHPLVFYLLSVAGLTFSTGIGLYILNAQYSRQNMYPDVQKPISDYKNYKIFTLPNQIHVMLITSNRTESSSIALKEEVGFMNDPNDFAGMSNYIQQLLQTSQKYPQSDVLRKLITLNSGKQQRIFNEHESIYYAQIQNDAFFSLIDILSRFFIDPIFTKQSMDRVLQTLHQQWKSMEYYDYSHQIITKNKHPYSKFYSGNLKTLFEIPESENLNPYVETKKYYRSKYSANRLSIVIWTHEDMKKRVTELLFEHFEDCVDKQLSKITYKQFGLPLKNQRFFYIQNPFRQMKIIFDFDIENNYLTKSLEFVLDMLMKQFKNNFCDEMIQNRQAFKCFFNLKEIPKEFAIFTITLHLPQQIQIDEILGSLYKRINLLKSMEDLEDHWNNVLQTQEENFNYQDNDLDAVINLSSNLKYYFSKEVLQNKLLKKFDKQAIKTVLDQMEPQNATIIYFDNFYETYQNDIGKLSFGQALIQQTDCPQEKKKVYKGKVKKRYRVYEDDYDDDSYIIDSDQDLENLLPEEEDIYQDDILVTQQDYDIDDGHSVPDNDNFNYHNLFGLYYFEAGISQKTINKLQKIQDTNLELNFYDIPKTHDLVTQNLDQQQQQQQQQQSSKKKKNFKYPELLISNQNGNLWHVYDVINQIPKTAFRLIARFLDLDDNYDTFIAKQILKINYKIPTQYKLSQISFNIGVGYVEIKLQCFSERLEEVSSILMQNYIDAFKITESDFNWYVEYLKYQDIFQQVNNTTIEKSIKYINEILTNQHGINYQNYDFDFQKIQKVLKSMFDNQRFDVLFYGNIDIEQSKKLFLEIIPKINSNSKLFYQEETYKLSKKAITYRLAKLKGESIVTLNIYQGSDPTLVQYVYMRLLQKLMKFYIEDYLFNQLQLGFAVEVSLITINHIDSLVIIVQSSSYDPEEIDFYIEESLGYFEIYLNKLPEKDFATIKLAIQKQYSQIPNTLEQQTDIIWSAIKDGTYYFTQRECTILALDKIQKIDLIKFFLIFFKARNSKMSLQLFKEGSQIPQEVLREQDTFAEKSSDLILNQNQFQQTIKETYKFRAKYIESQPQHQC